MVTSSPWPASRAGAGPGAGAAGTPPLLFFDAVLCPSEFTPAEPGSGDTRSFSICCFELSLSSSARFVAIARLFGPGACTFCLMSFAASLAFLFFCVFFAALGSIGFFIASITTASSSAPLTSSCPSTPAVGAAALEAAASALFASASCCSFFLCSGAVSAMPADAPSVRSTGTPTGSTSAFGGAFALTGVACSCSRWRSSCPSRLCSLSKLAAWSSLSFRVSAGIAAEDGTVADRGLVLFSGADGTIDCGVTVAVPSSPSSSTLPSFTFTPAADPSWSPLAVSFVTFPPASGAILLPLALNSSSNVLRFDADFGGGIPFSRAANSSRCAALVTMSSFR
mmetsp:Transcript_23088/g.58356  ORF Transcript_23088/g.58356 Transcript_23088/m.58356 type:complete len:339 (+) Transcript_23088:1300-2316(+)